MKQNGAYPKQFSEDVVSSVFCGDNDVVAGLVEYVVCSFDSGVEDLVG